MKELAVTIYAFLAGNVLMVVFFALIFAVAVIVTYLAKDPAKKLKNKQ